jgi:hypothetical protein
MGWFGGSNDKNNTSKSANGDAIYVDMEANAGLPIAVAIPEPPPQSYCTVIATPSAPPPPLSPPASPPEKKHVQLQPMSKQQALQMARVNPTGVATLQQTIFVSRTPTVLPHCPCCASRNVRTRTRTAPSFLTWVAVVALAFVFWPLCWIPLVTDTCRQTFHYCSNCNAEVGHIRAFQDCCVKNR